MLQEPSLNALQTHCTFRLTGPARTPITVAQSGRRTRTDEKGTTHISKVPVQDLHVTVDDL